MYMNFNRIMQTVNILFPHLEKKCPSLVPVRSSSITSIHATKVMMLLTNQGTAVFLAPSLSACQCDHTC